MRKHVQWLASEIDGWVARGLITPDQAGRIRQLYPEPKAGLPWGAIIFSGLGAVIVGLGVVLLFAYNWKSIPKLGKLGLVFLPLIGLHTGGIWLHRTSESWRQLGEALCLLATMLFGAGIWLIAQIYHIEEHFPNGFLIWGVGALAMGYALPSLAQGLAGVVALSVWGCMEAWGFEAPVHWAPALILIGVGGLVWSRRSRLLLFCTLTGFAVVTTANASTISASSIPAVLMTLGAAFIGGGLLLRERRVFGESSPVWGFLGWVGFLSCAYLLTYRGIVDEVLGYRHGAEWRIQPGAWTYLGVSFALMLPAWGALALDRLTGRPRDGGSGVSYEDWLVPAAAVLCLICTVVPLQGNEMVIASIFNLVLLGVAAAWMARGCQKADLRATVLGSLLLVALTTGRYFDLFESLAARGLVFLLVGGVLFAEGILYMRARRRLKTEGPA